MPPHPAGVAAIELLLFAGGGAKDRRQPGAPRDGVGGQTPLSRQRQQQVVRRDRTLQTGIETRISQLFPQVEQVVELYFRRGHRGGKNGAAVGYHFPFSTSSVTYS